MVWFQCEDCGENLKKPKLPNHFRICSANKLSCIDCGEMFSQQSVQSHTQCMTEAEKYGPKDQGKASHNAQTKPNKPKPNSDIDVNVGLSSHPPWFCSLCNTQATSKQTLLLHADGKKHRAKARAFHAAQKQSSQAEEPTPNNKGNVGDTPKLESVDANGSKNAEKIEERDPLKETAAIIKEGEKESPSKRKRKHDASGGSLARNTEENNACDLSNGEVIQAEQTEEKQCQPKKKKHASVTCEDHVDGHGHNRESPKQKIKWKKLTISTLKSNLDGAMKIKKLQKLVIKMLQESGVTEDKAKLRDTLMDKISSSSRFIMGSKRIQLVAKAESS